MQWRVGFMITFRIYTYSKDPKLFDVNLPDHILALLNSHTLQLEVVLHMLAARLHNPHHHKQAHTGLVPAQAEEAAASLATFYIHNNSKIQTSIQL